MRKYNINVNGTLYEVEVEEIGVATNAASSAAPVAAPAVPTSNANPTPVASPAPAGATVVSAPMPGSIMDIKVNVGDTVAEGDVLCVLEAMKMENEIMAPKSGTVAAINTSKGATVNTGDALVSIN